MLVNTDVNTIIFSPHLDDAVFSLGACLLAGLFPQPLVINIYTRSRYCIYGLGDEGEVTRTRMEEDQEAMRLLGITPTYWGFPDTTLKDAYLDEESYLNRFADPKNDPSYESVSAQIVRQAGCESKAIILSPLGLGHHVEHRAVADVCRELLSQGRLVAFYEDGSYYGTSSESGAILAQKSKLTHSITMQPVAFIRKESLVRVYSSQINKPILESMWRSYHAVGGERLWTTGHVAEKMTRLLTERQQERNEGGLSPFRVGRVSDMVDV